MVKLVDISGAVFAGVIDYISSPGRWNGNAIYGCFVCDAVYCLIAVEVFCRPGRADSVRDYDGLLYNGTRSSSYYDTVDR